MVRKAMMVMAAVAVLGAGTLRAEEPIEAASLAGKYRLHLFFGDTKPFLDELVVRVSPEGRVTGRMHVPDDFDADIENVSFDGLGRRLVFDLLVPKNKSRPVDLVFRYEAFLFPGDATRLAGFARIVKSDGNPVSPPPYVASFVAFRSVP